MDNTLIGKILAWLVVFLGLIIIFINRDLLIKNASILDLFGLASAVLILAVAIYKLLKELE